jgi:hypothetical protein
MNFEELEKSIIFKYWRTLSRKSISNILTSRFMKKPYLEKYIIDMTNILNDDNLNNKINEYIDKNIITTEDVILFINNIIELEIDEKKKLDKKFLNNPFYDDDINKISIDIILYQIKYFRIYQTIHELIFDNKEENDEHYYFIFLYVKNKPNEIKQYLKKNINFYIFYYYLNDLYEIFKRIVFFLITTEILKEDVLSSENDIFNLFLKNLFSNWYNIYKNDILEKKVNEKINKYVPKKSILSKLACFSTID